MNEQGPDLTGYYDLGRTIGETSNLPAYIVDALREGEVFTVIGSDGPCGKLMMDPKGRIQETYVIEMNICLN